MILGE